LLTENFILLLLPIYIIGLMILVQMWFVYSRKITKAAIEYAGENPQKLEIKLKPKQSVKIQVTGKTTILTTGWLTLKYKGTKQRIYKIRLINHYGEIELVNESLISSTNVIILKSNSG